MRKTLRCGVRWCCRLSAIVTIGILLAITPAKAQGFPDDGDWATVLQRYVNAEHRVDYRALRNRRDVLDHYAQQLAGSWPNLNADARKAALINAYNALTIRWIVENYPVASIWRTKKPFTEKRHKLNGRAVSLDDIETELRQMDPRIHGALVCAARSCPPLRREPYRAEDVGRQLDENLRQWLAMTDRNRFDSAAGSAAISKIFEWYKKDFDRLDGVPAVLARYGPVKLSNPKVTYQKYRWGLNDTSELGSSYSEWNFYWDKVWN